MKYKKQYGNYRVDVCPFCEKQATTKSKEEVPTCLDHKDQRLPELKCQCGDYLELRTGKYGAYFNCMKCGNINFRKAVSINPKIKPVTTTKTEEQKENTNHNDEKIKSETEFYLHGKKRKEITISSNDARYFD